MNNKRKLYSIAVVVSGVVILIAYNNFSNPFNYQDTIKSSIPFVSECLIENLYNTQPLSTVEEFKNFFEKANLLPPARRNLFECAKRCNFALGGNPKYFTSGNSYYSSGTMGKTEAIRCSHVFYPSYLGKAYPQYDGAPLDILNPQINSVNGDKSCLPGWYYSNFYINYGFPNGSCHLDVLGFMGLPTTFRRGPSYDLPKIVSRPSHATKYLPEQLAKVPGECRMIYLSGAKANEIKTDVNTNLAACENLCETSISGPRACIFTFAGNNSATLASEKKTFYSKDVPPELYGHTVVKWGPFSTYPSSAVDYNNKPVRSGKNIRIHDNVCASYSVVECGNDFVNLERGECSPGLRYSYDYTEYPCPDPALEIGRSDVCLSAGDSSATCFGVHTASISRKAAEENCALNRAANCFFNGIKYFPASTNVVGKAVVCFGSVCASNVANVSEANSTKWRAEALCTANVKLNPNSEVICLFNDVQFYPIAKCYEAGSNVNRCVNPCSISSIDGVYSYANFSPRGCYDLAAQDRWATSANFWDSVAGKSINIYSVVPKACPIKQFVVQTSYAGVTCEGSVGSVTNRKNVWGFKTNPNDNTTGSACLIGNKVGAHYNTLKGGQFGTCNNYCSIIADCNPKGEWENVRYTW